MAKEGGRGDALGGNDESRVNLNSLTRANLMDTVAQRQSMDASLVFPGGWSSYAPQLLKR